MNKRYDAMGPAEQLISCGRLPDTVQTALAARRGRALAYNPHLVVEAWSVLWQKQTAVAERISLAGRPLTAEQLTVVLQTETRERVLRAALDHNRPDDSQWELLAPKASGRLAVALWDERTCPEAIRTQLRERLDVWHALWAIAADETLGDTETVQALGAVPEKGPAPRWRAAHSTVAKALAATRPGTVPLLARLNEMTATAAAGAFTLDRDTAGMLSVHARATGNRFLAWALAANLTVTVDLLEPVVELAEKLGEPQLAARASDEKNRIVPVARAEGETLETLVRKCEPYGPGTGFKPAIGKPWNALTLAANSNLDAGQKQRLRDVLDLQASWEQTGYGIQQRARQNAWYQLEGTGPVPSSRGSWIASEGAADLLVATESTFIQRMSAGQAAQQLPEHTAVRMAEILGDTPAAWNIALDLLDSFTGNVDELSEVASSLA